MNVMTMIELAFILSIAGNAWQWSVNERQSETIETIKGANKTNANTIDNFKAGLTDCSNKLANWNNKEQVWQGEREATEQELSDLAASVGNADWGDCISPIDLEF